MLAFPRRLPALKFLFCDRVEIYAVAGVVFDDPRPVARVPVRSGAVMPAYALPSPGIGLLNRWNGIHGRDKAFGRGFRGQIRSRSRRRSSHGQGPPEISASRIDSNPLMSLTRISKLRS